MRTLCGLLPRPSMVKLWPMNRILRVTLIVVVLGAAGGCAGSGYGYSEVSYTDGYGYYDAYPEADRRSHAHSNYLHLAAEAGLAGLAAFALLLATALRLGWAALARAPDGVTWATAAGAWVGMIAFLVGGVTQYSFGDNEVAMAMWAALAVLMRCREA